MSNPTVNSRQLISVFSGCGGFDLGFKAAGFSPVAAMDSDKIAIDTYRRNLGQFAEIVDLTRECPVDRRHNVDVMISGPPCQGFSTAGNRNPDDARNHLLPLNAELAVRLNPKVVVVENVLAARSGEHSRYWSALEYRLRVRGYRTHTEVCDAADIGMAQRRRRVFLFAWRTGRETSWCWPRAVADRLDRVLSGVETQRDHNPKPLLEGSRLYRIAERIGPGQKLSNVRGGPRSVHSWHLPEVFGATTAAECSVLEATMKIRRAERRRTYGDADPVTPARLIEEFGRAFDVRAVIESLLAKRYLRRIDRYIDLVHTFNGKCRRFRWEDVSSTVDTRFGDPHLFLHPNEHRPFTVREAARIQGFPDEFVFSGAEKDRFRLVGNAVPPPMATGAAWIVSRLLGM